MLRYGPLHLFTIHLSWTFANLANAGLGGMFFANIVKLIGKSSKTWSPDKPHLSPDVAKRILQNDHIITLLRDHTKSRYPQSFIELNIDGRSEKLHLVDFVEQLYTTTKDIYTYIYLPVNEKIPTEWLRILVGGRDFWLAGYQKMSWRIMPSLHYIANHFIEDISDDILNGTNVTQRCLEEGAEHNHQRIKKRKRVIGGNSPLQTIRDETTRMILTKKLNS
jgi:hypothetical protein